MTDDRFKTLLNEIVPQKGNPLKDMSSGMDYEIKSFTYNHNNASLHASSVWALEKQHGNCSDYHRFCSALGRLLNSPMRVTYGIIRSRKPPLRIARWKRIPRPMAG